MVGGRVGQIHIKYLGLVTMTDLPRSRKGPAEVEAHDGHPVEHGDPEVVDAIAEQLARQRENLDQKFALAAAAAAGRRVRRTVGSRFRRTAVTNIKYSAKMWWRGCVMPYPTSLWSTRVWQQSLNS